MNGFDDASLVFGELFDGFDIGESQVISFADVGDDTDIAEIKSKAFA